MTEDPSEACLKVLNLDTLDRDALSRDYVHRLPDKLKKQPYWNNGRNHLLFNFFSGSFPDYSDEIDFPYGQAMLAKSSFSYKWYRPGFDVSLPLLPKKHREIGKIKGDLNVMGNLFPARRRYLLVFKGKRYLWGLGSETRNALHHLNNDNDIIMLTTCKHGKHWDKHKDYRCLKDNALYDK
jgi:glucuronyl/N-acetylglucosaminyl transferase EXT1